MPASMHNQGSADMSFALFRGDKVILPTKRNFGPGVIEEANERLKEEIAARRRYQASNQPVDPEQQVRSELDKTNQELAKARRRREALQAELKEVQMTESVLERKKGKIVERIKSIRNRKKEKTEQERRRQAAMAKKQEVKGAKPAGIRKTIPPKPAPMMKFSGFRFSKNPGV
ncbi:hypothetical protein HBH56_140250 [Parastagonospora nodorum]|uniref:Uncharacterized protein n=2 Tax=Phaeosphaeria nodorum (strain SN15 / ATCC MYA-4574 / FGSC 10173) TaxID=321614 RepID=A0A7U2ER78_PHANO|nr:hypothetical protein HBH56_140250 [Parastagonospora nodorum]QRC91539.1 hypothetical protein JI435_010440 [Parastagonospora nodorum SN15]KAH3928055.1 hypothetical protein HBH54_145390 [Parastagonospora nodorum]KAH3983378.1 hypothetical protein HBH51_032770 [Parastagonospora nodorum]KAH4005465.1 hypothetical protein HBI10_037920 [Parastagonospora nodorum]